MKMKFSRVIAVILSAVMLMSATVIAVNADPVAMSESKVPEGQWKLEVTYQETNAAKYRDEDAEEPEDIEWNAQQEKELLTKANNLIFSNENQEFDFHAVGKPSETGSGNERVYVIGKLAEPSTIDMIRYRTPKKFYARSNYLEFWGSADGEEWVLLAGVANNNKADTYYDLTVISDMAKTGAKEPADGLYLYIKVLQYEGHANSGQYCGIGNVQVYGRTKTAMETSEEDGRLAVTNVEEMPNGEKGTNTASKLGLAINPNVWDLNMIPQPTHVFLDNVVDFHACGTPSDEEGWKNERLYVIGELAEPSKIEMIRYRTPATSPGRSNYLEFWGSEDGETWTYFTRVSNVLEASTYYDLPIESEGMYRYIKVLQYEGHAQNGNMCGIGSVLVYGTPASELETPAMFCGHQRTVLAEGSYGIRFLATVNDLSYEEVGFDFSVQVQDGASYTYNVPITTVYGSVEGQVNGETVQITAESLGGTYLYTVVFRGIDVSLGYVSFDVTPYVVKDGVKESGRTDRVIYNGGEYCETINCS